MKHGRPCSASCWASVSQAAAYETWSRRSYLGLCGDCVRPVSPRLPLVIPLLLKPVLVVWPWITRRAHRGDLRAVLLTGAG